MHFSAKVLFDFIHRAIFLVVTKYLNMLIACFEFFYKEHVNNNKSTDRIDYFSSTPKVLKFRLYNGLKTPFNFLNKFGLTVCRACVFIMVYIIQEINDLVRIEIQISVYLVPRHGILLFIYVHSFTAWTCCSTSEKWGNYKAINFWNVVIVLKL